MKKISLWNALSSIIKSGRREYEIIFLNREYVRVRVKIMNSQILEWLTFRI